MPTTFFIKPTLFERFDASRSAIIEASAGTGKTYALEHLVLNRIIEGNSIENILVVTFTERATQELRERIRRKLTDFAAGMDATAEPPAVPHWTITDETRQRLFNESQRCGRAAIATIHGFCQRLLDEYAFAERRPLRQQVVDERAIFLRAFYHSLRTDLAHCSQYQPWLSAWLAQEGTAATLAEFLLDCHKLHLPFEPACDLVALREAVTTLATCADLPPDLTSLVTSLRNADDVELIRTLERTQDTWLALAAKNTTPNTWSPALERMAQTFAPFRAALCQLLLPPVRERLDEIKRTEGRYDFHDMLQEVAHLIEGADGLTWIKRLRERYPFVLIDEFQDTDDLQWTIFQKMFLDSSVVPPSQVIVIGDPKQSIYSFRGANVHAFNQAKNWIRLAGGQWLSLQENFRATPAMVDALNRLFDAGQQSSFFSDGEITYQTAVAGQTTIVPSQNKPVVLLSVHNEDEKLRADQVREQIRNQIGQEIGHLQYDFPDLSLSDIFVLTRTTKESLEIAALLEDQKIAYQLYRQEGIFQSRACAAIVSLLQAIVAPNSSARFGVWLTPLFDYSLGELARMKNFPEHPALQKLRLWHELAQKRQFSTLFADVLTASGLYRRLQFRGEAELEIEFRQLFEWSLAKLDGGISLAELASKLEGYLRGGSFPDNLEENLEQLPYTSDAVQIMTVHKAKGLEAKVVFLYGGFFAGRSGPLHLYSRQGVRRAWIGTPYDAEVKRLAQRELENENQRLLYVAATRAKWRLYLPYLGAGVSRIGGYYRAMNQRLTELRKESSSAQWLDVARPTPRTRLRAVSDQPTQLHAVTAATPSEMAALRSRAAGTWVTSYTQLHRHERRSDTIDEADLSSALPVAPNPRDLPKGIFSGLFLHRVLEELDLEAFYQRDRQTVPYRQWCEQPQIHALFLHMLALYDLAPEFLETAQAMVFLAMTTHLPISATARVELAAIGNIAREVDFIYQPPHSQSKTFTRGVFDLVFRHQAKTYFIDWKSDSLPSYEPVQLATWTEERYAGQYRIYCVALAKLVGIRSSEDFEQHFGGALFAYLRGANHDSAGFHFLRPTWLELAAWLQAESL